MLGCLVFIGLHREIVAAEFPAAVNQQLTQAAALRKSDKLADAITVLRAAHATATQINSNDAIAWTSRELASALMAANPGSADILSESLTLYTQAAHAFDKQAEPANAFLALLDAADSALRENCQTAIADKINTEIESRYASRNTQPALTVCIPAYWQHQGQRRLAQGQFHAATEAFGEGRKAMNSIKSLTSSERIQLDAQLNGGRALALWRAGQKAEAQMAFTQASAAMEMSPALTGADKLELRQNFALALLSWNQPKEATEKLQQAIDDAIVAKISPVMLIVPRLNLGLAQLADKHPDLAHKTLEVTWREAQQAQTPGRRLRTEIATARWLAMRELNAASPETREAARTAANESRAWLELLLAGKNEDARTAQRRWEDPLAAILTSELLEEPEGVNRAATAMLNVQGAMLEVESSKRNPKLSEMKPVSLEAMQHALAKNAAYVQITSHLTPAAEGHWEDTCSTLVLTSGRPPAIQPGPRPLKEWLQALAQSWNTTLTRQETSREQETELTELLQEAYEQLWEPIVGLVAASPPDIIYLCIDGPLSSVPWACLLDKRGHAVLESSPKIIFLSSPRALLRSTPPGAPKTLTSGNWLVVDASVEKESTASLTAVSAGGFPYNQLPLQVLIGPENEARTVAALAKSTQLLRHVSATELSLRQALAKGSPTVLHFAGHGSVNTKADGDTVPARFWEGSAFPSGFAQIGLFFPNFGRKTSDTNADDWLSAAEISQLSLQETELAVFSSCQGGKGLASSGEGRFDLTRAAHLAGVKDVLVATGPVWDKASVQFMQGFYQPITKGTDPATAAWEAQRSLWLQSRKISLSLAVSQAGPYRLVRHR
jgi:CHAT domain-containing protein